MLRVVIKAGLFVLLFNGAAWAQAFNCEFAKKADEITICRDDSLKALDEQMADRFFQLRQNLPRDGQARINAEQKEFLAARGFCGTDGNCIADRYTERLDGLCSLAADFGVDCP